MGLVLKERGAKSSDRPRTGSLVRTNSEAQEEKAELRQHLRDGWAELLERQKGEGPRRERARDHDEAPGLRGEEERTFFT